MLTSICLHSAVKRSSEIPFQPFPNLRDRLQSINHNEGELPNLVPGLDFTATKGQESAIASSGRPWCNQDAGCDRNTVRVYRPISVFAAWWGGVTTCAFNIKPRRQLRFSRTVGSWELANMGGIRQSEHPNYSFKNPSEQPTLVVFGSCYPLCWGQHLPIQAPLPLVPC